MNASRHGSARRLPVGKHPARLALVVLGWGSAASLVLLPLLSVFHHALKDGWSAYQGYLTEPATRHAIWLTLLAAGIAIPINTAFGLAAAWAAAKFTFPGRRLFISVIELPLSISPIVIGVAYLFVFGMQGIFGSWFLGHDIRLVFSVPAVIIVTTIVTAPYVFREVLPLMQSQGTNEEVAAVTLGAGGWQVFRRVSLPNIKWALIYGVSLTFARSLGEFGSVAVVSGAIRGETNTMALQIELLFNDRVQTGAFAVASLLTTIALLTLIVKTWAERNEDART